MSLDDEMRREIREAFLAGALRVRAVDPETGTVGLHPVVDVMRHETPHKAIVRTTLKDGVHVSTTVDHSLFFCTESGGIEPVEAGALSVEDVIASVLNGEVAGSTVVGVEHLPPVRYTYDLSVPGPENFVLSNGIVAHNSYSIGGVSLDIEKSSKYESAYNAIRDSFNDQLEKAKATVKIIKGLQQPRYGIGVRSSFGPHTGAGVLTPAKFMGF